MGPPDLVVVETSSTSDLAEQPFTSSAMGDSMDLSGETWVAVTHLNEATEDLSLPDYEPDLIVLSPMDRTLPAMALQLVVPAGERRGFIQR